MSIPPVADSTKSWTARFALAVADRDVPGTEPEVTRLYVFPGVIPVVETVMVAVTPL